MRSTCARRWLVALSPLLAVAVASCGLGERQAQADQVVDAVRLTASQPRHGTVSATMHPRAVDAPAGFDVEDLALDIDPTQLQLPVAEAAFSLDHAAGTAHLGPLDGNNHAEVLFDDIGIRLRRPDAAPEDARPWLALDYTALTEGSGELDTVDPFLAYGALAVLDPRVLFDLAAGPLAGSIAVAGTSDDGTSADGPVHYEANFDIPKALEDERDDAYDEDRLEHTLLVFDLLRVSGDVHAGEVWIDSEGLVERFVLRLHVRVERYVQFDLEIDLRLDHAAAPPAEPAEPTADEIVLVDSLVPLRRAAGAAAPQVALDGLALGDVADG